MESKAVSASIARFAVKFCNELEKGRSAVSSPLSAEYLLALVALGASDPAHSELLAALGIPDDDAIRSTFTSVSTQLRTLKGVTLNVANRIYVKQGPYELEPSLLEDAIKIFDAGIEKAEFNHDLARSINKWVENITNNKIKDVISADSFNNDTRLLLMNAIYFKGTWKKPFYSSNTRPLPFHVNAETTIEVPTMHMKDSFKYQSNLELGAQLLELPYEGGQASMVIILPKEIEGINSIMQKLADGYDLISELGKMYSKKVLIYLPTFKIESDIDLTNLLPKLGIKTIFSRNNSGLDKILYPPAPLYVSKAVQKAFIEVNEQGTEAAAVTHAEYSLRRGNSTVKRFICDRPFVYIIATAPAVVLNVAERNVLFIGVFSGN